MNVKQHIKIEKEIAKLITETSTTRNGEWIRFSGGVVLVLVIVFLTHFRLKSIKGVSLIFVNVK